MHHIIITAITIIIIFIALYIMLPNSLLVNGKKCLNNDDTVLINDKPTKRGICKCFLKENDTTKPESTITETLGKSGSIDESDSNFEVRAKRNLLEEDDSVTRTLIEAEIHNDSKSIEQQAEKFIE